MTADYRSIVLYDGVCGVCNRFVQFVIPRDPSGRFAFAALQSDIGRSLLMRHGLSPNHLGSIVLIDDVGTYVKSDAVLRIVTHLHGATSVARHARWLPVGWRDVLYDWFAQWRHLLSRGAASCAILPPEARGRMLDRLPASHGPPVCLSWNNRGPP